MPGNVASNWSKVTVPVTQGTNKHEIIGFDVKIWHQCSLGSADVRIESQNPWKEVILVWGIYTPGCGSIGVSGAPQKFSDNGAA